MAARAKDTPAPAPSPSPALGYDALFRSIARQSRVFPLKSECVTLLPSPPAFYEQLIANIRGATKRITISSLYLGTGSLERALVDEIALKLRENRVVQVKIVLDFSRGQRGGQDRSSVSMLKNLLAEFPSNVELFLYKVPQLKGVKAALPPPFNETMGVSHAKVYLVDDTLVLSGANLSEDYFTNRQDRYVQMEDCGGLAQFYHQFVSIVAAHSFQVQLVKGSNKQTGGVDVNGDSSSSLKYELSDGSSHDSEAGKAAMKEAFEDLVAVQTHPQDALPSELNESSEGDAWAFPTIQFTPVDVTNDEVVLSEFIEQLPKNSSLRIASGYLNFPPFLDELLVRCGAHLDVLLAAPVANGFFNANGIKGALPMAYSLIEQEFYEKTRESRSGFTTVLREFNRAQWTFHGKGMWWSPSLDTAPQVTIFGSSNFGRRSYGCDLESQVVLYTKNPVLQSKLKDEYDALAQNAEVVTDQVWKRPDRMLSGVFSWKYGHWIRPVTKIISAYL